MRFLTGTILGLLIFSDFISGQSYRFVNFGNSSNIPNGFIYTINQDSNGYLWVGTGSGISKFDGFNFYNVAFPDSSLSRYPTASYKDSRGVIWFGCDDGTVYYTSGNSLKMITKQDTRTISSIVEGPSGLIWVVPQGRLIYSIDPANPENVKKYTIGQNLFVFSACFTDSGELLLGTQGNIQVYTISGESITLVKEIVGFNYSNITAIHKLQEPGSFLAGTNGDGLFLLEYSGNNAVLNRFDGQPELDDISVQAIMEDSDKKLWISTNDSGVLMIIPGEDGESAKSVRLIDKNAGLQGNNISSVIQDMEGNYWIGLFGDGLSLLSSYAFSFFTPGVAPGSNNIIYVNRFNEDYFLGTPDGYYLFDLNRNYFKFSNLRHSIGNIEITSYFIDTDENIWIGTKGGGLYQRNPSGFLNLFHRSFDSGEDNITDIAVDRSNVWLGTLYGVVLIDRKTGVVRRRYNINNGLPHNYINRILLRDDGSVVIGLKSDRLYTIDPVKGISSGTSVMTGSAINEITSIASGKSRELWVSTLGNGVFSFRGDTLRSLNRADLLMSDFAYSILVDSVNRIWVGHQSGFSRYNLNTGIMRTFGTDFTRGGVCNPDGMYESSDGKMFIGTSEGLIIYDRHKDKNTGMAPLGNFNSITIDGREYKYQPVYTLPYKKKYDIQIRYVGISFSNPDRVLYQTMLENWDDNWSKLKSDREEKYSLSNGHYKFNMVSFNEDGYSQELPLSFEIIIKGPYWSSWWFILLFISLLTGLVALIIREREKNQKKIRAYLERELEARTSVVMKQKVELELQNIEITDSINYAKRIQTSILPDINKLKETFKDAFIFFRPRDIVSGDFYWFDKLGDDKFVLVCADSTGHGVPGAFMSMIGSTILQDIVTRQRISKPSQVLSMLDKQIFETLNQNIELGISNDGMDMVVCEINVQTRHIRFASAMRPVIIVLDGEPFYIRGNRSSVGGESVIEKYFDDQEYYLNEGDTIYMFSDGLPDQFGGTNGKKMKIAKLKKLIEDVAVLPMSGQKEIIAKFYDEWKGDYDQVDDILLMGIRL